MNVYLMRHGAAEDIASSDELRALTSEGIDEVRSVVAKFAERRAAPDRVITSPYLRTRQTAELVVTGLRLSVPVVETTLIEPAGSPVAALNLVAQEEEGSSILLVGHNPLLTNLLSLMLSGGNDTMKFLQPAQLACVEMEYAAPGLGELKYLIGPESRFQKEHTNLLRCR